MRARPYALLPLAAASLLVAGEQPKPTPTPAPPVLTVPATPGPKATSGSLADSVKKSRASATPVPKKKSLGTITNENLKKGGEGTGKGMLQMAPAHPIADLPPGSTAPDTTSSAELNWRSRANQARQRVESAESEVKRLEVESKRLENDFYAWSDGNYRDRVIKPAWDQSRDDLKKARAELDAAQAGVTDLEEEARKAGVPAGWLRETPQR